MAKSYNLPFEYVLYHMSYANTILYSSVLPVYNDLKEGKDKEPFNQAIDANNPDNFKNEPDEIVIRR